MLKIVTVTGADDSVNPVSLLDLSERYPFVEWGILLSKSGVGNSRFPSYEWLEDLGKVNRSVSVGANFKLSAHIYGKKMFIHLVELEYYL